MTGTVTPARRFALEVLGRVGHARVGMGMYTCGDDDPVVTSAAEAWLVGMGYAEHVAVVDGAKVGKELEITEAGLTAFHQLPPLAVGSVEDRIADTFGPGEDDSEDDGEDGDDDQPVASTGGPLPEFEGIMPIGTVTTITGTSQRITRAIHYGETGFLLMKWESNNVGHKKTADGMKRTHTIAMLDGYELTGSPAKRLFNQLAEEHRRATEADPLPFKSRGDEALVGEFVAGRTDGSGVALTPAELVALGVTEVSPVVVVFAGGERRVWPEDFHEGADRPGVGVRAWAIDMVEQDEVVQLLDLGSGRVLAAAGAGEVPG